ncbi:MAG: hypothetical protein WCE94_14650 [Candidatus Methanoperedens sp.]
MLQSLLFNYLDEEKPKNHPVQEAIEAAPDVDTDADIIFNTFFSVKEIDKTEPGIETQLKCGVCGAKLMDKGIDRGCRVLVCAKKCSQGYRIPIGPPPISPCEMMPITSVDETFPSTEIPSPAIPPIKTYSCRQCTSPISQEQAQKTFAEQGRALCEGCTGG